MSWVETFVRLCAHSTRHHRNRRVWHHLTPSFLTTREDQDRDRIRSGLLWHPSSPWWYRGGQIIKKFPFRGEHDLLRVQRVGRCRLIPFEWTYSWLLLKLRKVMSVCFESCSVGFFSTEAPKALSYRSRATSHSDFNRLSESRKPSPVTGRRVANKAVLVRRWPGL